MKKNREFLQLAKDWRPEDQVPIGSWFCSEKLDGMRAFWDGGCTTGLFADEVPWANTAKDGRYLNRPRATGLWSRYGKPIQAPGWWLQRLPAFPLDGELYMGRGKFQELISATKKLVPEDWSWKRIYYKIFDSPSLAIVMQDGRISNPNFKKEFLNIQVPRIGNKLAAKHPTMGIEQTREWLANQLPTSDTLELLPQFQLSWNHHEAEQQVQDMLVEITSTGGEGLILRHPTRLWVPERTWGMLKVKRLQDETARVIGYIWGRETDLGSKLAGLMGALVVTWAGRTFELSGFTDQERYLFNEAGERVDGEWDPGKPVRVGIQSLRFPIGSEIRFVFRELSDAGIPREARYYRG